MAQNQLFISLWSRQAAQIRLTIFLFVLRRVAFVTIQKIARLTETYTCQCVHFASFCLALWLRSRACDKKKQHNSIKMLATAQITHQIYIITFCQGHRQHSRLIKVFNFIFTLHRSYLHTVYHHQISKLITFALFINTNECKRQQINPNKEPRIAICFHFDCVFHWKINI